MARLRRHHSLSDRFRPVAGIFVIGNALMVPVHLLFGDYTSAATCAGLAALVWWLYRT
jgi:hypothetical protein